MSTEKDLKKKYLKYRKKYHDLQELMTESNIEIDSNNSVEEIVIKNIPEQNNVITMDKVLKQQNIDDWNIDIKNKDKFIKSIFKDKIYNDDCTIIKKMDIDIGSLFIIMKPNKSTFNIEFNSNNSVRYNELVSEYNKMNRFKNMRIIGKKNKKKIKNMKSMIETNLKNYPNLGILNDKIKEFINDITHL